ncbi:MAG: hypothetical protein ACKO3N_11695, partial [Verrucomicrobiota bacterium]
MVVVNLWGRRLEDFPKNRLPLSLLQGKTLATESNYLMKKQLTLLGSLLAATAAQAQLVPGGNFEYSPAQWPTYFTTGYTYVPTAPQSNIANFNALDGLGLLTINTSPFDL